MERVEVVNLDAWVARYLKEKELGISLHREGARSDEWELALSERDTSLPLSDTFYREEWEQVVQAQGIETEMDYLRAKRSGRGTTLTAGQRRQVWPVFAAYRGKLGAKGVVESEDAMRLVAQHLEASGVSSGYASVIVDEAQDLGFQAFRLIRALAGGQRANDLMIVGDPHQRIYGKVATLSKCGIEIRGRGKKLRINYRTTEETRRAAVQLLQGIPMDDLDGGKDDLLGYHSLMHGPAPERIHVGTFSQEVAQVAGIIRTLQASRTPAPSICLVARTGDYCGQLSAQLKAAGITAKLLDAHAELRSGDLLCLATMHRVKGLEFDHIIIAGLAEGEFPLPPIGCADATSVRRWTEQEQALLYVAMTRARRSVFLVERR
jgi:superfamily I DNA/RNA helicase